MMELVDVRLDHPRGGSPLLIDANLRVAAGEVVLIVGAAGAGTSRVVAAALGEAPASAGRIELMGRDVSKLRRSSLRQIRRRIGIVPQDLCLLEDRSAQLNVVMPLEIDGIPRTISIPRGAIVLAQLGLDDEATMPVDCLPASVRQRVAVARAMVRTPELILADHPTSAQDAIGCQLVADALRDAATGGAAVVVFSRDPALRELAELYGWRQLALAGGQLHPLGELEIDGRTIDEILIDVASIPVATNVDADDAPPNLVPFPRADARGESGPVAVRKVGVG